MKKRNNISFLSVLFVLLGFAELAQAHYSPQLGRFLSRDPVEERGGVNVHAFVRNNSTNRIDKLGLQEILPLEEVDNADEALTHYQSMMGGVVPAGPTVVADVKKAVKDENHSDLIDAIETQLEGKRSEICNAKSGKYTRNGGTIGIKFIDLVVGSVDIKIKDYEVNWRRGQGVLGFSRVTFEVERELSFKDHYIFNADGSLTGFFQDTLPEKFAGMGMPYHITGSFTDKVKSTVTICCWGQ